MRRAALLTLFLMIAGTVDAGAQTLEIHPYAGGFFPRKFLNLVDVNRNALYGAKAGIFLTRRIEAEGNFGYLPDLSFASTPARKKAFIVDGAVAYHIPAAPMLYVSAGAGGMTASAGRSSSSPFAPAEWTSNHFFSMTYGGGLKALRQWGPVGYRIDARGRTLPHYYGFRFSWLETTAGLTFSFHRERSK